MNTLGWISIMAAFIVVIVLWATVLIIILRGQASQRILGGYIYPGKVWSKGWQASHFPVDYLNIGDLFFDDQAGILLDDPRTTIRNPEFWAQIGRIHKRPQLMLSVSMGGYTDSDLAWGSVLSDPVKYRRLAENLVRVIQEYRMQGLALDWEPNQDTLTKAGYDINVLRKGFNAFAGYYKSLKGSGLLSVTVNCPDERSLTAWKNRTYDFDGLVKHIDRLEVMCYFKPAPFLKDVPKIFGIPSKKVILGIGLSSYSFGGVKNPTGSACAVGVTNDWGAYCAGQCKADGKYPSWSGDASQQNKWDVYPPMIARGQAMYRISRTGWPYLWFPDLSGLMGSVLPWVSLDIAEAYVRLVKEANLGGMFTWIITSDSNDGKMTNAIRDLLDGKTVKNQEIFPVAQRC